MIHRRIVNDEFDKSSIFVFSSSSPFAYALILYNINWRNFEAFFITGIEMGFIVTTIPIFTSFFINFIRILYELNILYTFNALLVAQTMTESNVTITFFFE